MFSILIPTYNNLKYLKLCLQSIKKNSKFNHQIIIHVNEGIDGTLQFLKDNNIEYTHTNYNSGICEGINKASKFSKFQYILYAHDDFYFCPNWDVFLHDEIIKIGHKNFYLSGTMMNNGHIPFNCGSNINDFDEKKFLQEYNSHNHFDFQGSTWAPTLVHKDIWNKVGGFSEEYFPGMGSDPDFNMKLWNIGVRIFKGINKCKVYHFGSIILRKRINILDKNNKHGSNGAKIFLKKWGITIKFFKRFYLKSGTKYDFPLSTPKINLKYLYNLVLCKINYFYVRIFFSKI